MKEALTRCRADGHEAHTYVYVCIYIYIYIYVHHMYIYIYIEREREILIHVYTTYKSIASLGAGGGRLDSGGEGGRGHPFSAIISYS